jgi:DNA-binding SARP family transcriptional activator/TolB-like protein
MATRIAAGDAANTRRWGLATAGRFALIDVANGLDAAPRTRKARAVLAYLASQPGQRFSRDRMASLFWGDRGDAQARASLRQALLEIRQATAGGPEILQSDRTHLWAEPSSLEPEALDETSWAHSDIPLFDDLDNISPEFDEWLALTRADRSRQLAIALRIEIEKLLQRGRGAAALPLIDRLHRLDPYDEDALRLALRAEFQAGRVAGIERRLREMDSRLQSELGVTVSSESRALRDELLEALSKSGTTTQANHREPEPELDRPTKRGLVAFFAPPLRRPALAGMVAAAVAVGVMVTQSSPLARPPKTIAVLPFAASAGADSNLADGLSQELLSDLSHDAKLRVIGRTSAWQFKDKVADLRTVGRQLGAEYLIEGSVRPGNRGVRVTASVIRARDGTAVWSRTYSASNGQLQPLQAAMRGGISAALGTKAHVLAAAHKPKGEAYSLYLKAKGLFRQRTTTSMESARTLMLEAIRIDPQFAPPWAYAAGITNLLNEERFLLDQSRPSGRSLTPREALEHALELDPNLADAHGFMGWIGGAYTADGYRHLRRAVELDPNNSQILFWYSLALYRYGDYGRYATVARKAAALDPLWQRPVEAAASASLWVGDEVAVRRYSGRLRAVNPDEALEVESSMATQRGDLSRSIEIALGHKRRTHQVSTEQAATNLMELGFESEGRLIAQLQPEKLPETRSPADRAALLQAASEDENFDYGGILYRLRIHGRYGDVAALYDSRKGQLAEIRRATYFNRQLRTDLGPAVAQALLKVGRKAEAGQILRLSEEAGRAIRASGAMHPCFLVGHAAAQAVAGRREEAIRLLQQTGAKSTCFNIVYNGRVDPLFESLRGDPRFERIVRRYVAHVQKERREVLAMQLF